MSPTIAGFECSRFGGEMRPPFMRQNNETVPGVDGQTIILDAWQSPESNIQTVMKFADRDSASTRRKAIQRLQTTLIVVVDPLEEQWQNVYVSGVFARIAEIADGTWEVKADWVLLADAKKPDGFGEEDGDDNADDNDDPWNDDDDFGGE